MNSFLDLKVQVDLFHEPVNHSPLPWAGISYALRMSPLNRVRRLFRQYWLRDVETAALSAVVAYYRRGVMKPTTIRLVLPKHGQHRIIGIASHGPQKPAFWRHVRRLTPSGERTGQLDLNSSQQILQKKRAARRMSPLSAGMHFQE